jgi:hypothetical protein
MRSSLPLLAVLAAAAAGCGKSDPTPAPATSSSTASSAARPKGTPGNAPVVVDGVMVAIPVPPEKVVTVVNPDKRAPYSGPKGTVRGKVRIDGDPPPDSGMKLSSKCKESAATYSKLFRVGLDNALADAMVAITGYGDRGFVPATEESVKVAARGCAPVKRTYSVTYGQRIDFSNVDKTDSYLPYLDGAPSRAMMVAVPGGSPIKLYPVESGPAHYMIRDQLPSDLVADVFVVNYATHDVTGLDGQYEIKNIPVGKVKVSVFLPVIDKAEEKVLEVKEGDNTLDFTLHFDAKKDIPGPKPAASASAKPAASASAAPLPPGADPRPKPPR